MEGVGEDVFADALGRMGFFQPVVAALVGLIPQLCRQRPADSALCGGSPPLFQSGGRAVHRRGRGLAVLWRANPSWKQNLFITGLTWAAGAFVGVAMRG